MWTNTFPEPLPAPPVPGDSPTNVFERRKRVSAVSAVDPGKRTNKAIQIGVFVVLSALLAVPIWLVKYPPLVDYPNHLARAFILHHLNDPHYNFAHFYASDWGLNPYFLADALIQVFQRFVGIYVAGRILLTLCILGLPLGVAFFLHRANPGNEYLALWALAIAYNPNFLMGFMSFELSVALCFFVVGVWLDYARTGEDKYWIWTLLLATLCFLTHLGGFGVAAVVIAAHTLFTSGMGRRMVRAVLVFVPGGLFFLNAKFHGWAKRDLDYTSWRLNSKLRGMLVPFREYTRTLEVLTVLAIVVTVWYFLSRRQKLKLQAVWIGICAIILAIHWVVPNMYGDLAFIDYRFCLFAFLFALAIPAFSGSRTLPITLAMVVILAHVVQAGRYFESEQKHLSSIAGDFKVIPRNALVLAYTAKSDGAWERRDDLHFWGYGVIERGWITPSIFHQRDVQPIQLRFPMYSDDDQYGKKLVEGKYSPDLVAKNYEYLWTSNTSYLDPYLNEVAKPILARGELEIFRSGEWMGD